MVTSHQIFASEVYYCGGDSSQSKSCVKASVYNFPNHIVPHYLLPYLLGSFSSACYKKLLFGLGQLWSCVMFAVLREA